MRKAKLHEGRSRAADGARGERLAARAAADHVSAGRGDVRARRVEAHHALVLGRQPRRHGVGLVRAEARAEPAAEQVGALAKERAVLRLKSVERGVLARDGV